MCFDHVDRGSLSQRLYFTNRFCFVSAPDRMVDARRLRRGLVLVCSFDFYLHTLANKNRLSLARRGFGGFDSRHSLFPVGGVRPTREESAVTIDPTRGSSQTAVATSRSEKTLDGLAGYRNLAAAARLVANSQGFGVSRNHPTPAERFFAVRFRDGRLFRGFTFYTLED